MLVKRNNDGARCIIPLSVGKGALLAMPPKGVRVADWLTHIIVSPQGNGI